MRPTHHLVLASLLAVSGCAQPRSPNDIPKGTLHEVSQRSEASGASGTLVTTKDPVMQLGVTPLSGWQKPSIPVLNNAQVVAVWFYPQKLYDGAGGESRTIRGGFWSYHIIRSVRWGMDEALHEQAVPLNALSAMSIDAHGNLVIDQTRLPPNTPTAVPRKPRIDAENQPKLLPHSQRQSNAPIQSAGGVPGTAGASTGNRGGGGRVVLHDLSTGTTTDLGSRRDVPGVDALAPVAPQAAPTVPTVKPGTPKVVVPIEVPLPNRGMPGNADPAQLRSYIERQLQQQQQQATTAPKGP